MASTILEQVLENIERGATIPLPSTEPMGFAAPQDAGIPSTMIRALESRILTELDTELEHLMTRITSTMDAATSPVQVREEISSQLAAVADAQLSLISDQLGQHADLAMSNLGSESALLHNAVPAITPPAEYAQADYAQAEAYPAAGYEPELCRDTEVPGIPEPSDSEYAHDSDGEPMVVLIGGDDEEDSAFDGLSPFSPAPTATPESQMAAPPATELTGGDESPAEVTQTIALKPEAAGNATPSRQVPINDIQAMIDQLI
ncbi:MAG: hypothetical protein AAF581_11330 [Planctomycetota bacterium]